MTYNPKQFWGFMFKGKLFRSVRGCTAMLQDSGKVCYYVNGKASTDMLHYNRSRGLTFASVLCYLSSGDMNSKLYAMELKVLNKNSYKQFKKDKPDLDDLFDCITPSVAGRQDYETIKECIHNFNKAYQQKLKT